MANDTKQLEKDVQRLLNKLTNVKVQEAKGVLSQLNKSATDRKELIEREKHLLRMKEQIISSVIETQSEFSEI